ncbi:hypothetical protein ACFYYS_00495 [Streptomyces sp. NPDC002120]|uniref:hypothetical protein n=1 Tax=Streptomyces sp. NPDC002120 TaxID=3364631 RepID=UPI0036B043F1
MNNMKRVLTAVALTGAALTMTGTAQAAPVAESDIPAYPVLSSILGGSAESVLALVRYLPANLSQAGGFLSDQPTDIIGLPGE